MRPTRTSLRSPKSAGLSVVLATAAVLAAPAAADVPPTTPPGITLVEVMRELPISQPEILWVRPGDQNGRTLFLHADDQGVPSCTGKCAEEFPPLAAPRGAKEVGDWSVVVHEDFGAQWAYQGRPLHTWVQEQVPGEVATNVGLTETAGAKFAEDEVVAGELLPPDGWEVARFQPVAAMELPDNVDVALVHAVHAVVLTDAEGLTLYADASPDGEYAACSGDGCNNRWKPLVAPLLATGLGDFSVVTRRDGTQQWAYQDRPLYRFADDQLPGDAHGAGVEEDRTVAAISENFRPANVGAVFLEGYGSTLTLDGMTLYGGYPFEKRWGGRNLRDTFTYVYAKGKRLNGAACTGECLETWRPFLAPDDAQPNGFWEPVPRADGRKHWAYKGYALYTYEGDDAPGEHYGQATYDFADPSSEDFDFERVAMLQEISNASGGVGIYWNIAKP